MKIYDASTLLNMMEVAILPDFSNSGTVSLALYEIGNAVWKQVHLTKKLSQSQGEKIVHSASLLIEKMQKVNPDSINTLKLGIKENMTFYEASYLQVALSTRSELVTDDKELRKKSLKYVDVSSSPR